ncbi:MAG TPA: formyltransferase family protein [Anaerolineales bacterium]|nr:formyltransferase family protein [Anaerolineales bacterium]
MTTRSFMWLGASDYALRLLETILVAHNDRLVYLIDAGADRYRHEIAQRFEGRLSSECILDASMLKDRAFLAKLMNAPPHVAISAHFREILADDFLKIPVHGVVNVHSAFLPYNRGHWPEVWSILRGTPAGITLHYIDNGIDTGDFVVQREVPVALEDTCDSLAKKIEDVGIELMTDCWHKIIDGTIERIPQTQKLSLNLMCHLEDVSEIKLNATYTGAELLNRLRALTIPRLLKGAFFIDPQTGERIHVRVEMSRQINDAG